MPGNFSPSISRVGIVSTRGEIVSVAVSKASRILLKTICPVMLENADESTPSLSRIFATERVEPDAGSQS